MGSSSPEKHQWELLKSTPEYDLVRHSSNLVYERYTFHVDSQEADSFIQKCQHRKYFNLPSTVKLIPLHYQSKNPFCSSTDQVQLFCQSFKRLYQISELHQQIFDRLNQAVDGFNSLITLYGSDFTIDDTMLAFDCLGRTQVWFNTNFALGQPSRPITRAGVDGQDFLVQDLLQAFISKARFRRQQCQELRRGLSRPCRLSSLKSLLRQNQQKYKSEQ